MINKWNNIWVINFLLDKMGDHELNYLKIGIWQLSQEGSNITQHTRVGILS